MEGNQIKHVAFNDGILTLSNPSEIKMQTSFVANDFDEAY